MVIFAVQRQRGGHVQVFPEGTQFTSLFVNQNDGIDWILAPDWVLTEQ